MSATMMGNDRAESGLATGRVAMASAAASGVSWGAIMAGAAGAAALSLILLVLGVGLGLTSASPWSGMGASATALSLWAIAWLTLTQAAASGLGGYLAGRLRTKWVSVHTDEVYFRDTAHGFLAWAVATLLTATVLTSATGSVLSAGASVAGGVATTAVAAAAGSEMGMAYVVDTLLRKEVGASTGGETQAGASATATSDAARSRARDEIARILARAVRTESLSPGDSRYLAQVVAQQSGLPWGDAQKRVADTFGQAQSDLKDAQAAARDAADKARHASAVTALWLCASLLIGAFVASLAATYGGHRRDL